MKPLLLLDTNYLCHRAFHAMSDLAFGDVGTGAIYGVLKDIILLQELFYTDRMVFCFDGPRQHRYKLLPSYKESRRKKHEEATEEEQEIHANFRRQIQALGRDYLPSAGFRNVYRKAGFEADDLIAALALSMPQEREIVIIGSDHDMWQCLRPNVYCWNPYKRKAYTLETFKEEWGIEPQQWADVKALAGCTSDDVPGIPGVGEKKAAQYLRGDMNPKTKTYAKIEAHKALWEENLRLVRLPFEGTPVCPVREDKVTEELWKALADKLGMKSIRSNMPRSVGRRSRGRKRGKGFGFRNA